MSAVLRTEGLGKAFGTFVANDDVNITLPQGARHALIGPNGAGKTTLINLLTGVLAPTRGDIFLNGDRVTTLSQHARVRRGLSRTFQINTLFPGLTVLESVMLAVCQHDGNAGCWYRGVASLRAQVDESRAVLAALRLDDDRGALTRDLPYGKQRLVEIALALATRPSVLLLDEPAAGIPADASEELFAVLANLPRDVSVLFIEHDMGLVFRFAERIIVMAQGRVLAEGTPADIARDPRVKEVYLGEAADA